MADADSEGGSVIKLSCPRGHRQSKTYSLTKQGELKVKAASRQTWWRAEQLEVKTLRQLYWAIKLLEDEPSSYLVSGSLTEHGARRVKRGALIRRRSRTHLNKDTGREELPTIADQPATLFAVDIDDAGWVYKGLERDLNASLTEAISDQLPPEFHHADFIYQLSGSCLIKDPDKLKVHLFFELETPQTLSALKRLALSSWPRDEADKLLIDPALFTVSQPIYTARPLMKGALKDPFPGDQRSGFIRRGGKVSLPEPVALPPKVETKPLLTHHQSLSWAARINKTLSATDSCDLGARAALNKATEALASTISLRHNALIAKAYWLGRFVGAQRLNAHEVLELLREACLLNGYLHKVGEREVERVARDGIAAGAVHPLYDDKLQFGHQQSLSHKHPNEPEVTEAPAELRALITPQNEIERPPPSSPEVIESEVLKVLNEAFTASEALRLVKLPTGAGKTHLALKLLAEMVERGRSVLYLVPNHALLKEAEAKLASLSTLQPVVLEGQLRTCQLYQDREELRPVIDELREEGLAIPRLCAELSCPFWERCETRKRQDSIQLKGRFTLAAHAMLPHLKELPEELLIVIDESPQMVYTKNIPAHRLSTLVSTPYELTEAAHGRGLNPSVKWRLEHALTIGKFIEEALPLLAELHRENLRRSTGYSLDLDHKALKRRLSSLVPLAEQVSTLESAPLELNLRHGELAHALVQERKAHSLSRRVIHSSTVKLAKTLAQVITGEALPLWMVSDPTGALSFEYRAALKLPKDVQLCAMDATPHLASWRALASQNDRQLTILEGDQRRLNPHLARGVWLKSKAYRTSRLLSLDGSLSPDDTRWALNSLYRELKLDLCNLPDTATVGVGTHKVLAEAIEVALNEETSQDTVLKDHELIKLLRRFKKVVVGYSGRDNLASNRFEDCQTLVIIGAPKSDLRTSIAELKTLNPKADLSILQSAYQEKIDASLAQWVGRLRLLRSKGRQLIYAGDHAPPEELGIKWVEAEVETHRPRYEMTTTVESMAIKILERGLTLSRKMIIKLGATVKASRGIIARLKARVGVRAKWLAHGELLLSKREQPKDPAQVVQELVEWLERRAIGLYKRGYLDEPELSKSRAEVDELVLEALEFKGEPLYSKGWTPGWWGGPLLKCLWPPPI